MTENEIKETREWLQDFIRTFGCNFDDLETRGFNECVMFLKELEQYRAIGTIEEFKALKEKNEPKKVNIQQWIDTKCDCGYEFSKHHGDGYYSIPYEKQTKYCPECGRKLDWQ